MTGQERILAAIKRQEPDRVPTMEWDIDSGLIKRMTAGGGLEDFVETIDKLAS